MLLAEFGPEHPAFAGHFPGDPMVPGALLLDAALAALAKRCGVPYEALQVRSAKFLTPVRPGETVRLAYAESPAGLDFQLAVAGAAVAAGLVSVVAAR